MKLENKRLSRTSRGVKDDILSIPEKRQRSPLP